MTGRRAVLLAARRELRERARSRAFRASTALQLVIVVAIVALSSVFGDDGPERFEVAVAGAPERAVGERARAAQEQFGAQVGLRRAATAAEARGLVEREDVDAAIAGGRIVVRDGTSDTLTGLLQAASRRGPPPLPVAVVGDDEDRGAGLAFIGTLALYVALLTFGYALASSVVEEKSSRVVELVLSAIRPVQLLAGKIIGVGVAGLAQLVIIGAGGLIAAAAVGDAELPASTAATIALVVLYFVLGYAFYACAFAAAGAIVSRQEDIQSTTSPMLVALVGGYLASFAVMEDPDSTAATVLSLVPPLAPFVVPARAARDALGAGELALSVALMLAGTALLLAVAARIYERAVLRFGAPLKLTEALRLARR